MKTIEIRKRLIEEINASNNKTLLEEMYNLFSKDNAAESVYRLSKDQKLAIDNGRNQIKNGQAFANEEVNLEVEKWLNEK